MAYGIEAFKNSDPLAWPGFATKEDVTGLPPTVISVNECDPLRDEGIAFYRLVALGRCARARSHGAGNVSRRRGISSPVPRNQPQYRGGHRGVRHGVDRRRVTMTALSRFHYIEGHDTRPNY